MFLAGLVEERRGEAGPAPPQFVMHADDDSFVRLDLLLPLLVMAAMLLILDALLSPPELDAQATSPRKGFYWGYIWDGTGNRKTAPIRDERNKSRMPQSQVWTYASCRIKPLLNLTPHSLSVPP